MVGLLWTQTLLILIGIGFSYFYMSSFDALSAAYGGGISLFSSLILSNRASRAVESLNDDSQRTMALLYMGVMQRYVFVLLGLGFGLALLELNAKPLLAVFGITQLAYFMPWLGNK